MKAFEERIRKEGKIAPGGVLRVGSFVNQQIDIDLMCECGKEFHRLFKDAGVNKILTIEASGIGIACLTAQYFGAPVVFAKKSRTTNVDGDVYSAPVYSFTHNTTNQILVPKDFLTKEDTVLIIDDFLATGAAFFGLISLCEAAGAKVAGCGALIEKEEQGGGNKLRGRGIRVESLARIAELSVEHGIRFVGE